MSSSGEGERAGECGRGGRGGGGDSGSAARREGRRNWADSVVVRVRREGVSVAILVVVAGLEGGGCGLLCAVAARLGVSRAWLDCAH